MRRCYEFRLVSPRRGIEIRVYSDVDVPQRHRRNAQALSLQFALDQLDRSLLGEHLDRSSAEMGE